MVKMRMAELGIDMIRQGADDKLSTARSVLAELRLRPAQTCYIGDDLADLPVALSVGLAVAVADGCEELRRAAHDSLAIDVEIAAADSVANEALASSTLPAESASPSAADSAADAVALTISSDRRRTSPSIRVISHGIPS